MHRRTFAALLLASLPLAAQDQPFRLVPSRPAEPPQARPDWHDSFAAAEAAARQQGAHVLLYFTAKWCGPCKRMESETFSQPEVLAALTKVALARLDIDEAANVEVCRRWHGNDGVPAFVLLDPAGGEVHRWVGGGKAERFLGELRAGMTGAAKAEQDALEHHAALAGFYLERNDAERGAEQLRAIERLDPGRRSTALENARWVACAAARQRGDWAALRSEAQRYLALPDPARAEQVRLLLGIAEFETTGTMTPALQAHVDARIAVISTPTPGTTLGDRVARLLGKERDAGEPGFDSGSFNKAMNELVDVGRASAQRLREVLLHKPGAAMWAAIVLARLRLPESTPWLAERLADPATPPWTHRFLVLSIGHHKEARCLPTLLHYAGEPFPAAVRAEAVDGLRNLLVGTEGPTSPDVAEVLGTALEARDRHLLGNVLQALFCVQAPLALERLVELLDDERSLGFLDYRLCDNALWILTDQLGMSLERADGTPTGGRCSREIAAWLRAWHKDNAAGLRWDAEAKCYRLRGKQ